MSTLKTIKPPWTPEQVDLLNESQQSGRVHPFTCGQCRDKLGTYFIKEKDGTIHSETDEEFADDNWTKFQCTGLPCYPFLDVHDHPTKVHRERALVATLNGWICPTCDYTQKWAYELQLGISK